MAGHTIAIVTSTAGVVSFALGWVIHHSGIIKRIGRWLSFTGDVLQEAPDTVTAVESGDTNKVMTDMKALITGLKRLIFNNGQPDNDNTKTNTSDS